MWLAAYCVSYTVLRNKVICIIELLHLCKGSAQKAYFVQAKEESGNCSTAAPKESSLVGHNVRCNFNKKASIHYASF